MVDNVRFGAEGSRMRILVVEDDLQLAKLVENHLTRAGHGVHVENRGEPALVFAAEHRVDLVVLDQMLPDMSAREVCRELRRIYHPWILPVVMLTGLNSPKYHLLSFSHGADASLTRRVAKSELVGTVNTILSPRYL